MARLQDLQGAAHGVVTPGQEYEGFFFTQAGAPVTFTLEIQDYVHNRTLATTNVAFPGGGGGAAGEWQRVNFSLTTSGGTTCVDVVNASDPDIDCDGTQQVCVKCGGQFVIGLGAPGSAHVDYVYLQPGEWGRFEGLPVLAQGVATLQEMGIRVIRQGGSYEDAAAQAWKNWRGPAWLRPSLGCEWGPHTLISGWGPFEMADLCKKAGIEHVMTTWAGMKPSDYADLVEYVYGGPSTEWGKKRIEDGHPDTYDIRFFELGARFSLLTSLVSASSHRLSLLTCTAMPLCCWQVMSSTTRTFRRRWQPWKRRPRRWAVATH